MIAPRPLELRLMHREVEDLLAPGGNVSWDSDTTTVIRYRSLEGATELRWREPAR